MEVAPATLLLYAEATMCGAPGLRAVSMPATAPVSGLRRRFWPVSLTTRMRSAVGLKSKPNAVPDRAGVNGAPTAVAMPVAGFTT